LIYTNIFAYITKKYYLCALFGVNMTILSIDTSTRVCSAALSVDGITIASRINREDGNHARQLPVFVDELLAEMRKSDLQPDAVALSEGPGSYTGLRIGAGIAKGLCYGLHIPLIPIPTTEVLCAGAKSKISNQKSQMLPLIDARRMEVYTARYDADINPLTPIQAVVVEDKSVFCQRSGLYSVSPQDGLVFFFGDGADKCRPILESDTWHFIPDIVPDAANMGELAEKKFHAPATRRTEQELAYYEPFYLKEFVAAQSHVKGLH